MTDRRIQQHGVSAGLSTIVATGAGALINIATSEWSWSVGIGLAAFVGAWASVEIWRAVLQADSASVETLGDNKTARLSSLAPPWGLLPEHLHGRDEMVSRLERIIGTPDGRVHVICGLGGCGKTAVALATAQSASGNGARVWWINARDETSLTSDLTDLALQLGAWPQEVTQALAGLRSLTDLVWLRLEARPMPWLLVIDNADDPTVLTAAGAQIKDGNGLARGSKSGIVLITSRVSNAAIWGESAVLHKLRSLTGEDGARVLRDITGPAAGTDADAIALATRLGGMPLALTVSAKFLASNAAKLEGVNTFGDYQHALDRRFAGPLGSRTAGDEFHTAIAATWELSLNLLARQGLHGARRVMQLMGIFTAAPLPVDVLDWRLITSVRISRWLRTRLQPYGYQDRHRLRTLSGLCDLALLDVVTTDMAGTSVTCVAVHPLVTETNVLRSKSFRAHRSMLVMGVSLIATAVRPRDPDDLPDSRWLSLLNPHLTRLLEHAGTLPRASAELLVECSIKVDRALYWSGDYLNAFEFGQLILRISTAKLGAQHPLTLAAQHGFGRTLICVGRVADALPVIQSCLESRRQLFGPDHPDTLGTQHNYAFVLAILTRYDEAEREYRAVIRRRMELLGPMHRITIRTRTNHAHALADSGRFADATREYVQLLEPALEVLGPDDAETEEVRQGLAGSLAGLGRYAESEREYRAVLGIRQRLLGPHHPETLASRQGLAGALVGQERFEEAETEFRAVAEARDRVLGSDHPETLASRAGLVRAIAGQGRKEEAERERQVLLHVRWPSKSPGLSRVSRGDIPLRRRHAEQTPHAEAAGATTNDTNQ